MTRLFYFLCLGSFLFSCGNENKNNTSDGLSYIGKTPFSYLEEDKNLNLTGETLKGSGKIIFENPLDEAARMDAELTLPEGSSVGFVLFGDNKLKKGLSIILKREKGKLDLSLSGEKKSFSLTELNSSAINTIKPGQRIKLRMEIHNNENPAHILVWVHPEGSKMCGSSEATLDSEKLGWDIGNGGANFAGAILKQEAELSMISFSKAEGEHHGHNHGHGNCGHGDHGCGHGHCSHH